MFFLTNQSFKNKKVIMRVDLNVPLDSSLKVTDATRIIACRETIDYVKAMWLILQQNNPDDYVCATGISHTEIGRAHV